MRVIWSDGFKWINKYKNIHRNTIIVQEQPQQHLVGNGGISCEWGQQKLWQLLLYHSSAMMNIFLLTTTKVRLTTACETYCEAAMHNNRATNNKLRNKKIFPKCRKYCKFCGWKNKHATDATTYLMDRSLWICRSVVVL